MAGDAKTKPIREIEPAPTSPEMLAAIGRDIEGRLLAEAVKLHIEGRIFLNGAKKVIFR